MTNQFAGNTETDVKGTIPRLNQCYLCKAWYLEKNLQPIEVPDQAGYVKKQSCKACLRVIMEDKREDH
jgi:hypothetical protein